MNRGAAAETEQGRLDEIPRSMGVFSSAPSCPLRDCSDRSNRGGKCLRISCQLLVSRFAGHMELPRRQ
jgi:hypothetical protein